MLRSEVAMKGLYRKYHILNTTSFICSLASQILQLEEAFNLDVDNVNQADIRRSEHLGRLLNVLCTFNLWLLLRGLDNICMKSDQK